MITLRRAVTGIGFVIAALLGAACAAITIAVVVQMIRGSHPMGKDFIGIPLIALLTFLLLKAARDLWRRLRSA